MRLAVDFLAQNLLGASHCQSRYLLTQTLFGSVDLLIDFSTCAGYDAVTLGLGCAFGFFDDFASTLFCLGDDVRSLFLGCTQLFAGLFGSLLQLEFARPSAMVFWRVSTALSRGGQISLTVNQIRIANETACASIVKLMFISVPCRLNQLCDY